ncbi:MAG: TlpA disulfide reductase family protein [Rikenellaceae bacterium]
MKRSNNRLIILLVLTIIVALAMFLLPSGEKAAINSTQEDEFALATLVKVGEQAPDFRVEMNNGESVQLSDLRGKVVMVCFWATWCPPCREEFKYLQDGVINRFMGQDFVLLPIAKGEQAEEVDAFAKDNGYHFPIGVDTSSEIYNQYASGYIPRNFIIDQEGVVVETTVGFSPEEFANLMIKIQNTINKNITTKHGDNNHSGGCC